MGEGVARVVPWGGAVKQFAAVALGVCAGLLLGFAVKAGLQWVGCKAYNLAFSDLHCWLMVMMR
jgi:hypothetical protein